MQRTVLNSINNSPNFYLFLVMIFRTSVQNVHHATVQSFYLFGFYPYSVPQCSLQIRTPQGSSTGLHSTLFGCSGLRFLLYNVCYLCVDVLKRNNIKVYCLCLSAVFEPLFWRLRGIINIHSRPFCRHIFCISLSLFLLRTGRTELLISACSFSFLTAKRTDHHYYRLTS